MHLSRFIASAAVALALPALASANVILHRVTAGFDWPLMLTNTGVPGDGRLFVVEQPGEIRIVENEVLLPTPFLDLTDRITPIVFTDERGLLGLAFHPDYENNGHFYVNYCDSTSTTYVSRFTVTADPYVADPASEVVIFSIQQPDPIHNGGSIAFSPIDGYLYVPLGDGGPGGDPSNRAQNPAEYFGKILRLDVDGGTPYAIPPDNPFVGDPGTLDEIWALGLRNPYRSSFDRLTGDLWIADVGQASWEEVDLQLASSAGGENYGWRRMEGTACSTPPTNCDTGSLTYPVYEYGHGTDCAIIGGYVYRGSALPIEGKYFFADYCTKKIWSIVVDNGVVTEFIDWTESLETDAGSIHFIVGFGEDVDGELYIVDRGTGITTGDIFKIIDDGTVAAPPAPALETVHLSAPSPNPFAASTSVEILLAGEGGAEASVHDAAGRLVRRFEDPIDGSGPHRLTWDGRDDKGRRVPAGVYFLRVSQDGSSTTRSIRLVR